MWVINLGSAPQVHATGMAFSDSYPAFTLSRTLDSTSCVAIGSLHLAYFEMLFTEYLTHSPVLSNFTHGQCKRVYKLPQITLVG